MMNCFISIALFYVLIWILTFLFSYNVNSQGQSLMPWDNNFETYTAFQKSLSVLEDQIANFTCLKLFFIKYIERDILQILGYSLLNL